VSQALFSEKAVHGSNEEDFRSFLFGTRTITITGKKKEKE
jgi:hypothetical protein